MATTSLTLNEARTTITATTTFAEGIAGGITDVAFAPDGTLYVLTTSSIQRIRPDDGNESFSGAVAKTNTRPTS